MKVNLKNNETGVFGVGGLWEIGKNTYGVQFQDEIILMDCGVKFPEDDLLGIDYVIPDYSYLLANQSKIKGIFISHGHEDHIGGIPFLLKEINVPIYASKIALSLIRNKLEEHGLLRDAELHEVTDDSIIKFRKTTVSFYRTTHSIPDAMGIVVKTPSATIVFTGDYKFDLTPVGLPSDLHKMARIGEEGVTVLLADSTNSEIPGFTNSEQVVFQSIRNIIKKTEGRIIFATFASNVSRLAMVTEVAQKVGRKLAVFGRSMETAFKTARELGYIKAKDSDFIPQNELDRYPAEKTIILCTGSQGEQMAALSRIANGTHRQVTIQPGDTVVFSSSAIPGNTVSINRVINLLSEAGAHVIHGKVNNIHTSGHGSQEEQKLMLRLMKPKFFMPVHGEYRMLKIQANLAQSVGVPKKNSFIMANGDMLAVTRNSARLAGSFPAGDVYVDGKGIGDIGNIVLRDRKILSEHGMVVVVATIDYEKKQLLAGPDIISRGFIYMKESGDLLKDAQNVIRTELLKQLNEADKLNERNLRSAIIDVLSPYLYDRTQRKPIILPVLLGLDEAGQ